MRPPLTDISDGQRALGRVAEYSYTGQDRERLARRTTIGRDFVTRDGDRLMIVVINGASGGGWSRR